MVELAQEQQLAAKFAVTHLGMIRQSMYTLNINHYKNYYWNSLFGLSGIAPALIQSDSTTSRKRHSIANMTT